jgi:hypothetical protein
MLSDDTRFRSDLDPKWYTATGYVLNIFAMILKCLVISVTHKMMMKITEFNQKNVA